MGQVRRVREEVRLFLVKRSFPANSDRQRAAIVLGKHFYSLINQMIKVLVTDALISDQRSGL